MEDPKTQEPQTPLDGVSERVVGFSMGVASAVTIAMLVVVVGNAVLRTLSGSVVPSAFEMGMLAMPILVFLALPWTFYEKRNYRLDLLYSLFPVRGQRLIALLHTVLYLGITVFWTYGVMVESSRSIQILEFVPGLWQLPVYPAKVAIAIGCVLVLIVLFRELIQKIRLLREPVLNETLRERRVK